MNTTNINTKIELTEIDKVYVKNIAGMHEVDATILEKLYVDMLTKAKAQKKFKEMIERMKAKQANN